MGSGFAFDHPQLLHLLWATPVLAGVYVWGFVKKRRALGRFASAHLLGFLTPAVSVGRQRVKAGLVLVASVLLVIALAGPRWGTYYEQVERRGIDIVFVLDVSNSMRAEDVSPNRLERAKLDIKDMLEVLRGDRVGLVTFAGNVVQSCPLTINYGSFRLALEEVDTRSVARGGTNLGDAIRFASESFVDRIKEHKAIVLITDGDETEDSYAVEAAQKAFEEYGVRVFAVGVGDLVQGARIPVQRGGQRVYMKYEGQEVWTKQNRALLEELVAVAGGGYFAHADFREMYEHIYSRVAPREFESARREIRYARFHYFAGAALVLLMMESVMSERKGGS